jgi:AraC family transcriptional regulator
MLNSTCLEIDVMKPASMHSLLPLAPIFSSTHSIILIDHHCQPAWGTPNFYSLQNIITIFVGQATQVHQTIGRNTQQAIYAAGKVGIYPAHQPRTLRWEQEAEFIDLYLSPETINRYIDVPLDTDSYELLSQFAIDDLLIYSLGLAIKQQSEQSASDFFYVESAMTMLITHLLRYYSTQQNLLQTQAGRITSNDLSQIIDYIHAHLDQNPSLVELATLVNLSAYHFVKVFKASMGITPHQYLLTCRIKKAQQLLHQKSLSLAEISLQVGFHDQSRFTSVFRKRVGFTPKQYRDRL